MTQWIDPSIRRYSDPGGLIQAWIAVLTQPRQFFRESVVPGEQASSLLFAMVVVAISEATRILLVPDAVPVVAGMPILSAVFWLGVAVLLVTPLALHLIAALQTILLIPFVSNRGGISETVQVLAYATAPCVLVGIPIPELQALVVLWGFFLLTLGISEVHGTLFEPAAVLSALPAALVFGYGFRGFTALETVLRGWYII